MPNDSETRVKRMAHFSWSWRSDCGLVHEVKQGGWSMAPQTLQGLPYRL